VPRDESGGRMLLGDNTSAGDVVLQSIRFQVCCSMDLNWTQLYTFMGCLTTGIH